MTLASNPNLNKTKFTVRTVNSGIAKFLSLTQDAQVLLISGSNETGSNTFFFGSSALTKDAYFAINEGKTMQKLMTFNASNIPIYTDIYIQGNICGSNDLGNMLHKWENIYLDGSKIQINNAVINYEVDDPDCYCETYPLRDILFKNKADQFISIAAEYLHIEHIDKYYSKLFVDDQGVPVMKSFKPDNSVLSSVNLDGAYKTSMLLPGSNLYFSPSRTAELISSMSNLQSSNLENIISIYFNVSSNISNISKQSILNQIIYNWSNSLLADISLGNIVSSNIISSTYADRLNTSNNIKALISSLQSNISMDSVIPTNTHKFIVNNIYDSDLVTCNITTIGNVIPTAHIKYNLGSPAHRWKELYLSGNTIYINNTAISSDPLTNNVIIKNAQTEQLADLTVASLKLRDAVTGDLNHINAKRQWSTDTFLEGSNLFYKDERVATIAEAFHIEASNYALAFYDKQKPISADLICNGNSNQFIVNSEYTGDLFVNGSVTASNLIILGKSTSIGVWDKQDIIEINSATYDAPALTIISGSNFLQCLGSNGSCFAISSKGYVGIGTDNPFAELTVNGNINFTGSLNDMSGDALSYLRGVTSNIQEQIDNIGGRQCLTWSRNENNQLCYLGGNVGIGTDIPLADIHVKGDAIFEGSVLVKDALLKSADARMYTYCDNMNSNVALERIMLMKPKSYNNGKYCGFNGHEMSRNVHLMTTVIPNIFCTASCSNNIIKFDTVYGLILPGICIRVIDNLKNQYKCVVLAVDNTSITIDRSIEGNKVFVYGTEVSDFHTYDESYINTLNVSATQCLSHRINRLADKISILEKSLTII